MSDLPRDPFRDAGAVLDVTIRYPESRRIHRLLDTLPHALDIVAQVVERGRETHAPGDDWRNHDTRYHLDRARKHLALYAAGDTREPHLAHAAVRLTIALELEQHTE